MKQLLSRAFLALMAVFGIFAAQSASAAISVTDTKPLIKQGVLYDHLPYFTITGTTGAYTVTVSGFSGPAAVGFVPGDLQFNPDGTLSGLTCAKNGSVNYTVTVTDTVTTASFSGPPYGNTVNTSPSGACQAGLLTVAAGAASGTQVGASYSQANTPSGGTGPYTCSVTAGSLPAGTTLNTTTCTVTGTPTTPGAYSYTITARDTKGNTGTVTVSGSITAPAITINTASLNALTTGASFGQTISTTPSSGTSLASCAVTAGSLPVGLSLNLTTCTLSGTPTTPGPYSFTIKATSSANATTTQAYSGTIAGPSLALGPATLPNGTLSVPYSQSVVASGGTGTYTNYAITGGALPPGLSIDALTGLISGTPSVAGPYSFTVTVTDSSSATSSRAYSTFFVNNVALSLSPGSLPNGTFGTPYSQTLSTTASGGSYTAPLTYAVASGSLPPGLALNPSTGAITGIPTLVGTYTFTVTSTDSASPANSASQPYTVSIAAASLSVGPPSLPAGTLGTGYSQTVTATGGDNGPYTYSLASGSLPTGLTLNASTGVISGTPTVAGTYNFTIQAADSSGNTGTKAYSVVLNGSLALNPASLPAGTVGSAYSQTVTGSGGTGGFTYAVTGGVLPPGLSLDAATGVISGNPTVAGSYPITITATDSASSTVAKAYVILVNPPVSVTTASLQTPTVGAAYSQPIAATGGTGTYTNYAVSSGTLPPGLSLDATTGVISGLPTSSGSFTFTVEVTDSAGNKGSYTYTLGTQPPVTVGPSSLASPIVGGAYNQTVVAAGGTGTGYTYAVTAGSLPAGLSLNPVTGAITGTPSASGTSTFTVEATDSAGNKGNRPYTLTTQAAVTVGPASLPTPTVSTAYSTSVVATGGTGTGYTYAVTAGSLPAGLTLNASTGVISGTPTASGTSTFTIEATDSAGNKGNRPYTLTTQAAVTVGPASLATPIVGGAYNQTVVATGGTGTGYTYAVTAGALPAGLSLNPATGAITGTPTASGTSTFTVEATDSAGNKGNRAYTLTTQAAVAVGPATLPAATNGTAYTTTVVATGGTGTGYTYALTSGALPPGLTLNASTGVISGTPSTVGTYNFTVEATDSAGNKGNRAYALQLNPGAILTVGPATLPAGMVGINYSQTITATGGTGPYTCSVSTGSLPPGLTLNATTCAISGKPTASGSYTFTARVQDKDGNWGTRTYTLLVDARPDPTKDAQVIGQIDGQFAAATRFAQGQVDNVMRHLESQRSDKCGVTNTLAMSPTAQGKTDGSRAEMNSAKETAAKDRASTDPTLADWLCQQDRPITLWVAGSLDRTTEGAQRFHSDALTVGIETQFGQRIIGGIALGAGFGNTKVGTKGTRSTDSAQSGLLYLTADLKNSLALDAIVGYQGVSFDTKRYVTTDGSLASGSRDGSTFVLSLGLHGDMKLENATFTPYVRLDRYSVDLKSYQETGNSPFLLGYASASQSSTMGLAGLRFDYGAQTAGMQVRPMARVEWRHRFSGSYNQAMWYEDLPDTRYNLVGRSASTDALSAGVGLGVKREGLNVQLEVGSSATSLSSFKGAQVSLTLRHDLR